MKTLYDRLPDEEINEDEGILTYGDDIALQFYYGNWSDAAAMLTDMNIEGKEFAKYLRDMADELGYACIGDDDFYGGHFSASFWIGLGGRC